MKPFPQAPPFRKLIGPSFIIIALGLGSGEVILWPYLASNYGLGIAWGAIVGITFQYFINMEIERYALVKGESVFVGMSKMWQWAPVWFIISTFVGFGLPGIIAASAKVFCSIIGIEDFRWVAIAFLILIGVVLSSSKTVYSLMEKLTKTIILLGVPSIFILVFILSDKSDWLALANGIIGIGNGYNFFPEGMALATFLGAFAYSGAGGNLNLTQSIYIKEKGYGMGKYSQKIAGLFHHRGGQEIKLDGESFEMNNEARTNFKKWWRKISVEHALVFWFLGALSIALLMLLSFVTSFGNPGNSQGISFVINEGTTISAVLSSGIGIAFLFVVAIMLLQTQLGVMDSTSRIMAENTALEIMKRKKTSRIDLSKIYFLILWIQIIFGISLFLLGISEPKMLIVSGACLNAIAMFVHIALVQILNHKTLPKEFRPALWRKLLLGIIFLFFGVFSAIVLVTNLM